MTTIKLDSADEFRHPEKGHIIIMPTGQRYIVVDKDVMVTGEGMDVEMSVRYTLKRIRWYHRVWYWIKRKVYGK